MADKAYQEQQWQHRYDSHIASINRLVDSLKSSHGEVPYVAPIYGGINASLLSVLRDPGPKTMKKDGSGFLSLENDDATAETIYHYFKNANISFSDVVPWNVYPWYINRKPVAAELNEGMQPLFDLIALLPKLRVVMLHGGVAQNGWRKFTKRYPNLVHEKGLHVIKTYHTSRQAFWHKDPKVRKKRKEHLKKSFEEASKILYSNQINK
jgi:uracil-DNA glycosylase